MDIRVQEATKSIATRMQSVAESSREQLASKMRRDASSAYATLEYSTVSRLIETAKDTTKSVLSGS